ncbi:MAG TPA: peptidase M22 [Clostridiales bacterium]|nr:peptidase M22 [Clostridiales bacterium]
MSLYLGIDTSNYTTSAALFDSITNEMVNKKRLLEVKEGSVGLRQSEALFAHVKALPEIMEELFKEQIPGKEICAVGVSAYPRDIMGSYMPCFLAGVSAAASVAAALGRPLYKFSHQCGHIAAALFSAQKVELINQKFIAFHVSGGTTEAVLVRPDSEKVIGCEIVAKSLDLNAGQAIDRIGRMLGLPFPAGPELDSLARKGELPMKAKPVIKGYDCCISGLENQCAQLKSQGCEPAAIARYAIEYIAETLDQMAERLLSDFGKLPLVFAGGVMSNSIISQRLKAKYGAFFATPEYSSDNATGIALLAHLKRSK